MNGGWSQWSTWGECSARCGRGIKKRTRQCNNPVPVNEGQDCKDDSVDKDDCFIQCPGKLE